MAAVTITDSMDMKFEEEISERQRSLARCSHGVPKSRTCWLVTESTNVKFSAELHVEMRIEKSTGGNCT